MIFSRRKYFGALILLFPVTIIVLFFYICWSRANFVYGDNKNIAGEQINGRIAVAFRNDDISSFSDPQHEYEILKIFRKYEIKPLYSVIPSVSNKPVEKKMRIANYLRNWHNKGWIDIAQHGFTHKKNRYGAGEFRQLPYVEQLERIKKGKEILDTALNMDVKIFCPPWNVADEQTLQALSTCGFTCFSGYVGSTNPLDIKQIDSNCNLFEGPLGSLMQAYKEAKSTEDNALLVVLFHTSYDFNENSLLLLKSILSLLKQDPSVTFVSFGDLQSIEYRQLVENQNNCGDIIYNFWHDYKLRTIKKINKIFGIKLLDTTELRHQIRNSIWKNDYMLVENNLHDTKCDINLYLLLISSGSVFIVIVIISIFRKYDISYFKKRRKLGVK